MAIPRPHTPAALPASALPALARVLRAEAGPEVTTRALQRAGYEAGEVLYRDFAAGLAGEDAAGLPGDRFWDALAGFLSARGWGRLNQSRVHPGLGLLTAHDWAEARQGEGEESMASQGAGCPFTTGLFARLLGEVAEGPIAVLQVSCPTRGDDAARFLFGHPGAVERSYGLLTEGLSLDQALERL